MPVILCGWGGGLAKVRWESKANWAPFYMLSTQEFKCECKRYLQVSKLLGKERW
jgi:hypothetical protein